MMTRWCENRSSDGQLAVAVVDHAPVTGALGYTTKGSNQPFKR
jgi:hypothetical protein